MLNLFLKSNLLIQSMRSVEFYVQINCIFHGKSILTDYYYPLWLNFMSIITNGLAVYKQDFY